MGGFTVMGEKPVIFCYQGCDDLEFVRSARSAIKERGRKVIAMDDHISIEKEVFQDSRRSDIVVYFSADLLREAERIVMPARGLKVIVFVPDPTRVTSIVKPAVLKLKMFNNVFEILPQSQEGITRLLGIICCREKIKVK